MTLPRASDFDFTFNDHRGSPRPNRPQKPCSHMPNSLTQCIKEEAEKVANLAPTKSTWKLRLANWLSLGQDANLFVSLYSWVIFRR
jgi:hypothetical protein